MAQQQRGTVPPLVRLARSVLAGPRALVRPLSRADAAVRRSPPGRWLTARHRSLLLLSGLLLVAGAGVHVERYPGIAQARADRAAAEAALAAGTGTTDQRRPAPDDGQDTAPGAGPSAPVLVGPAPTDDPAGHVERRTDALADADPATDLAVVSFDGRRVPAAAAAVAADGRVLALLVRLPDGPPTRVDLPAGSDPDAVVRAALAEPLDGLAAEAAELEGLLASGTVSDPEFEEEYRDRLARLAEVLDAPPGPVVHAVVLQADLVVLQEVATAAGVRLVDPAPPGTDPAAARFVGLEPEAG